MSVNRRLVIAPNDRERTAVVTVALPAGGEMEIDRTWRFVGWLDEIKLKVKKQPQRLDVFVNDCVASLYGYGQCALESGHDGDHQYEDMEP